MNAKMDSYYQDEFSGQDGVGLAELIATKQIKPEDLLDAVIKRVEQINPTINAFASLNFDQAKQDLTDAEYKGGALFGLPFALKESSANQRGVMAAGANKVLKSLARPPTEDSLVGARLRKAGLITIGSTAAPEFTARPTTDTEANGTCRNPWDLKCSVGGSSGGAVAAVASGMLPVVHASDGGGSIRSPAAWAGVVGMKPSRGRVPYPGQFAGQAFRVAELAVSRTVRDTAAILDCLNGNQYGDFYTIAPPERPYLEECLRQPKSLKIGFMTEATPGVKLHPECKRALEKTAVVLTQLGHRVEEAWPPILSDGMTDAMYQFIPDGLAKALENMSELLGRPVCEEDVEPFSWASAQAPKASLSDFLAVQAKEAQCYQKLISWWDSDFDILLTPSVAFPALTHKEMAPPPDDLLSIRKEYAKVNAFVRPFNMTGQPAISLPLHWTAEGLPIGLQFVAEMGREDLLIQLSAQLEQAMPWIDRRPPVFCG